MKLCVLNCKLEQEPLHELDGLYLYNLSIDEYKKCILKSMISIATDKNTSICYQYASDILKAEFKMGEDIIGKSGTYSFWYAKFIIKSRFELGEESISRDSTLSFLYANDVLQGRFELGEESIKNSNYIITYSELFGLAI